MHELKLDYPAPRYAERYAEITSAPISFGRAAIELTFDADILTRALPTADPLTYALAVRQCEADLAKLPARRRLVSSVRELLYEGPGRYASCAAVAETLEMNARALRRALAAFGTSYQTLLDDRRREDVLRFLRSEAVSLSDAAEQLGFSDVRSMRRSVHRWTGMSLQELRARTRAADS